MIIKSYEKKIDDFIKKTNTTFKCEFLKNDFHFLDDDETRDIYKITLKRGSREYVFNFGQSIIASGLYFCYTPEGKKYAHTLNEAIKLMKGNSGDKKKNKDFKEPLIYDVLPCLTINEVGSFRDFCANYGYSDDSIKAKTIYEAVIKEYEGMKMLYNEQELEELSNIL